MKATIHSITRQHVPGGRYVTVRSSMGEHSTRLADSMPADTSNATALFAEADEMAAKAARFTRWANLYRQAAWEEVRRTGQPAPREQVIRVTVTEGNGGAS